MRRPRYAWESPDQKRAWAEMGEVIEPTRRYDCGHYPSCLSDAAHMNASDLACRNCRRYRFAPVREMDQSAHFRLLLAIFLPREYRKVMEMKASEGRPPLPPS